MGGEGHGVRITHKKGIQKSGPQISAHSVLPGMSPLGSLIFYLSFLLHIHLVFSCKDGFFLEAREGGSQYLWECVVPAWTPNSFWPACTLIPRRSSLWSCFCSHSYIWTSDHIHKDSVLGLAHLGREGVCLVWQLNQSHVLWGEELWPEKKGWRMAWEPNRKMTTAQHNGLRNTQCLLKVV